MRDCSVCRDSRGLITRTCSSSPPRSSSANAKGGRRGGGGRACLRRASNQRRRDATLRSIRRINRSSILAPRPGIVSAGKSSWLCFAPPRIDPVPRTDRAASRPYKLRAYKCSISSTTSHCSRARSLSCGRFEDRASSSRGRDCEGKLISGECGIIPIDSPSSR